MFDSPTFAVHVDCDNSWVYENELGLKLPFDADYLYRDALPRQLALMDEFGIKASFFIIGKDLALFSCREFCAEAVKRGHKLANHSLTHPMHFGRMSQAEREAEIRGGHTQILEHTGQTCRGFRAPGYGVCDEDLEILSSLNYAYDSSVLPGPTAMLIKLTTFTKSTTYRTKSLNVWQNFWATSQARRYALSGERHLWRIPVAVMPWLRLPVHTSFAFMLGHMYLNAALFLLHRRKGHHIMLLHGLDLANTASAQGDIQIPVTAKPLELRMNIVRHLFRSIAPRTVHTEELLCN